MPYLPSNIKEYLKTSSALSPGELNYTLTVVIKEYLYVRGLSYQTCNDMVVALDNCKDEFRRRIQHPYEDEKIKQNGDVYDSIR